jgi:hypothetical protein
VTAAVPVMPVLGVIGGGIIIRAGAAHQRAAEKQRAEFPVPEAAIAASAPYFADCNHSRIAAARRTRNVFIHTRVLFLDHRSLGNTGSVEMETSRNPEGCGFFLRALKRRGSQINFATKHSSCCSTRNGMDTVWNICFALLMGVTWLRAGLRPSPRSGRNAPDVRTPSAE